MTGVADLSAIDLNSIENIQVIKSGNSMLYGEGAIGGIVDMTSIFPEKTSIRLKTGSGIPLEMILIFLEMGDGRKIKLEDTGAWL